MRIFIGYDPRETVAYHVAAHSIIRRATIPVSITPLRRESLPMLTRPRGEHDSTEFAISRFLVPYLCNYDGIALFLDCDVIMLADVKQLETLAMADAILQSTAVRVVKHQYTPRSYTKFLGQKQSTYNRKNWSSVMLFNCNQCKDLRAEYVNEAPGLDLHQFAWLRDEQIGVLSKDWNVLVGEENQASWDGAKILHFSQGTPCFPEYNNGPEAGLWQAEYEDMRRAG
jgi:hypothetical protein